MPTNNNHALRWMSVFLLGIAAMPLVWIWHKDKRTDYSTYYRPPANENKWIVPDRIEVELKPGEDSAELSKLSTLTGTRLSWRSPLHHETEIATATLTSSQNEQQILTMLRADPHVADADVEHIYKIPSSSLLPSEGIGLDNDTSADTKMGNGWRPNDPRFDEQWNFKMVHAEQAWETDRGKGVVVAVIDTGVAYANTRKGFKCKDFNTTRFVPGYDFVAKDGLPNDDNGHGTHVAGTIAESTNNGEGVAGLAFDASIMPLKVLSAAGGGSSASIAEAIRYAADHGANVINMSLGGPIPDRLMRDACSYAHSKGVTIVCAAGNSASDQVGYPAGYNECIAVSAVGPTGELSFYSNYGKVITVAAPGGDTQAGKGEAGAILQNTVGDGRGGLVDGYYAFQGTSMASPHVAAIAALIEAAGVKRPSDVKRILEQSAQPKAPRNKYGAGIVDAGAAVNLASNIYNDAVTRIWMVVGLLIGCVVVGESRRRSGKNTGYPFWSAAAISLGLLLPDWLTNYVGLGSHLNILTHSVIIPIALILFGAKSPSERRLIGWLSFGLMVHLITELVHGTVPYGLSPSLWVAFPWIISNLLVGSGICLTGVLQRD